MRFWGKVSLFVGIVGAMVCAMSSVSYAASSAVVTATVRARPPLAYRILLGIEQPKQVNNLATHTIVLTSLYERGAPNPANTVLAS